MLRVAFAIMAGIGLEIAIDNRFHSSARLALLAIALLFTAIVFVLVSGRLKNVALA